MRNGLGVAGALLICVVGPALAQEDGSRQDFRDADVKDVLRTFCNLYKLSFTIDSKIHGRMTINLKDKTINDVLQLTLGRGDIDYQILGGVYHFIPRRRDQMVSQPNGEAQMAMTPSQGAGVSFLSTRPSLYDFLLVRNRPRSESTNGTFGSSSNRFDLYALNFGSGAMRAVNPTLFSRPTLRKGPE